MNEYPFTHNQAEHRFELDLLDGTTALACYVVRADGAVILTHTEVPPRHEGQGIGSQLLARTLAALRADGRRIVPQCSFAVAYVNRHPEWQELLADQ